MNLNYSIKGIDCANCANELEKSISKIKGVKNVTINFFTEKMHIELESEDESVIKDIKKCIKKEEPDVELEEL